MAKQRFKPNYQSIYPDIEISEEILTVMKKSDRKMEYQEYDLKREHLVKSEDEIISIIPSREDSIERLSETGRQFLSELPSPGQEAIEDIEKEILHRCLSLLNESEQGLINALFFRNLTQQKYASEIGLSQMAVSKRLHKILRKLKISFRKMF